MNNSFKLARKNPRRKTFESLEDEGVVVVLLALIFVSIVLVIAALVIDHFRGIIATDDLQKAADASALAAAKELDGTLQGWKNAKRAAIAVLKQNKLYGTSGALPNDFALETTQRMQGHNLLKSWSSVLQVQTIVITQIFSTLQNKSRLPLQRLPIQRLLGL